MFIDAMLSKLCGEIHVKHKIKPPENIYKVYFSNKSVKLDKVTYKRRTNQLISLLKSFPYNFVATTLVHKLVTITYNFFYFQF